MIRIAIIGSPGVGKSTVCRNVLKQLTCTYGGMTSADTRVKGKRVGSYQVNIPDLNNIGAAAIKIIDEIAPMEFKLFFRIKQLEKEIPGKLLNIKEPVRNQGDTKTTTPPNPPLHVYKSTGFNINLMIFNICGQVFPRKQTPAKKR